MFYFDRNFGFFLGPLTDNKYHKHYALQISVSTQSNLALSDKKGKNLFGKALLLPSKVEHALTCNTNQLTILINPLSSVGHYLKLKFDSTDPVVFNNYISDELLRTLDKFERNEWSFEMVCQSVSQILTTCRASLEDEKYIEDKRILKALDFMDIHFDDVLSLVRVAGYCNVSPTRFLHLFKEKTNLSFRRYQLWNKLVKSLPYLTKNSITDTAHVFGFSDSSHYTRTFSETFGVTPKFFLPKR